jgi:hypothetical protein
LVDAPPPDLVRYLAVPHDELVLGRTAGVDASFDDESAAVGKSSFPATNGVLDEHARCEILVIDARRPPRLTFHREAACLWFTIGILEHQSDSRSVRAHAPVPPVSAAAVRRTASRNVGGRADQEFVAA